MKFNVKVITRRGFFKVERGESVGLITIGISAKREKGKANYELRQKLAKHFDIPISNIKIIHGFTSKNKIVEILGL